jgi:hypothetical protein
MANCCSTWRRSACGSPFSIEIGSPDPTRPDGRRVQIPP